MNKNFNLENAKSIIAEASGVPVNTTFGSITKPIDLLLEVIDMSADLIALIHEETELKKHHRAYLHVHEELEDCADQMAERMQEIFDETTDCVIKLMKDVHETFRVRKQEAAEDDADTVTIAKEDYETMIDDLLTMSEIIQCVADMRTQDVKACLLYTSIPLGRIGLTPRRDRDGQRKATTRQCALRTSRRFRSVSLPRRTAPCSSGSRSLVSVKHSKCWRHGAFLIRPWLLYG